MEVEEFVTGRKPVPPVRCTPSKEAEALEELLKMLFPVFTVTVHGRLDLTWKTVSLRTVSAFILPALLKILSEPVPALIFSPMVFRTISDIRWLTISEGCDLADIKPASERTNVKTVFFIKYCI
jgi:hypothetical protein